ncbi:MerC domain-containing protein [bacterium]|nr:MAG: MerC domain-containing protein [bacterium]
MRTLKLNADRVGTFLGTACAVHCALSGLALASLSVLGASFWADERLEIGFIGLTLTVGSFAALRGFQRHRSWRPAVLFVTAVALVISAHLMGHAQENPVLRALTTVMAVGGALTLVLFHRLNNRMCGSCGTTH